MKPWMVALGGGVAASAVLLAVFVSQKKAEYEERARVMEAAMSTPGGTSALAREAAAVQQRLQTYGRAYTEQLAQSSADAHMTQAYGLSRSRMAGLERLSRTLGL